MKRVLMCSATLPLTCNSRVVIGGQKMTTQTHAYLFSRQHLTIKNSIRFDPCRKLQPTSNVNASCDNVTSTDDPVKKSSDGERNSSRYKYAFKQQ